MAFGDTVLQHGMHNDVVVELQIRLAGFRGTLPDGDFGPGTELHGMQFQRDFMKQSAPTGIVDAPTFTAIHRLDGVHDHIGLPLPDS